MYIQYNTCPGCELFETGQYLRKFTPEELLELGGAEEPSHSWKELSPQMQSLMHIAHWLENQEHLLPIIQKEGICLSKKKLTHTAHPKVSEESLINFAKEHIFHSDLQHFKEHHRMQIEWFFADFSRNLNRFNPLSKWVCVNHHSCIPFDIATTFGELGYLMEHKARKIVELKSKHTIYQSYVSLNSQQFDHLNLTPMHRFVELYSKEVPLSHFKKIPVSPCLNLLRLELSDDASGSVSPHSPGSGRRRPALTPRSLDLANFLLESPGSE